MNDRELLEMAARAAGIEYEGYSEDEGHDIWFVPELCRYSAWNPLSDDGDALRLAVKLEIDLSFYTERDAKVYAQTKHLLGYGTDGGASYQAHEYHKELYEGSSPYTATRRAIVRAAAEIGTRMK